MSHTELGCAAALLAQARRLGCNYLFTNLGSDHPAFIEAFNNAIDAPQIIVCPHEMTALSAAHGHAMISRRPQLVLVHVDVGTQNLGGSVHNIARARVPAIIVAGLSPLTADGSHAAGRNEFIHYLQDVPAQSEIVRQYMKWVYELRAPQSVHQVLLRGKRVAEAPPQGPVYITGARELWEQVAPALESIDSAVPATTLGGLSRATLDILDKKLAAARQPLILTTSLGRYVEAVAMLVALAERHQLPVMELAPQYVNFPGDHPLHVGYRRHAGLTEADLVIVLDADVPWLPQIAAPGRDVPVFWIDEDPLKAGLGMHEHRVTQAACADSREVLVQLGELDAPSTPVLEARKSWCQQLHASSRVAPADPQILSPERLCDVLQNLLEAHDRVLYEAPTATETIAERLARTRPGTLYHSGASALGWGTNAALGARLAAGNGQEAVVALVGDGCYLFGVPSSTFWVSQAYGIPFLTVIFNNGGWNAPRLSTLGVHPEGRAQQADRFWSTIGVGMSLSALAEAAGVRGWQIDDAEQLEPVMSEALAHVRSGESAVVEVRLPTLSQQQLGDTHESREK